ncbi:telomerase reverse transcriptase isoform X2 [Sphaerodactylus townsendi]|uniref:telomerase reverse transcriptase isoform X2 n=1 Tax=Sphaerodactylus townsendi TaxID=933632 RepID=UPI00202603B2|nr:telomerase reverse transcriptase isoform X2 [Sphaerodactylus townsendi]
MEQSRRPRALLRLLRSCYAEVLPLEAAVRGLQAGGPGPWEPLVGASDPPNYRDLVHRCLVGLPAQAPPPRFGLQQLVGLRDVVERVIHRACEKQKKNVLAFGYSLLEENKPPLPGLPNICSFHPNNMTEAICQSVLWEMVLTRVGDELMMYLLEHCALFMLVPPSCCYQICGQPIYELTGGTTAASPAFLRQMYSVPSHNALSRYLQGRLPSWKHYLGKAKWRKRKSEIQGRGPQKALDGRSLYSSVAGRNPTNSESVTKISDYPLSQRRPGWHCSAVAFVKRKRENSHEINRKRLKIRPADKGFGKQTPISAHNVQFIGDNGSEEPGVSVRSCLADTVTPMKDVQERESGAQTSGTPSVALGNHKLVCGKALKVDREKETLQNTKLDTQIGRGVLRSSPGQKVTANNLTVDKLLKKNVCRSAGETCLPGELKMCDLLYSSRPREEHFPEWFVLNRLKGYQSGGQKLVETIFLSNEVLQRPVDPCPPNHRWRKKRLPKRYWNMRGLFQELLRNHAKCPYLAVLQRNCPVLGAGKIGLRKQGESLSRSRQAGTENLLRGTSSGLCPFPEPSGSLSRIGEPVELSEEEREGSTPGDSSRANFLELLKQNCSHWQVYTFLRECLERVVPAALWGSSHNKCRFYKNVKKLLSLGKLAAFSLRELTWKMRVNDCAWLRLTRESGHSVPASEHCFRTALLSKFLCWLMDSYVAELLRSFFYITETMFQKNLLFFFRKAVWSKLQSAGVRSHLAAVHLRPLSKEELRILQQRKHIPLAARLRFIPKMNGLRPVVKLSSVVGEGKFCRKSRDKKVQYFNTQLKKLFSVLNYERVRNPSLLGSSAFGRDDIYAVWKKFVLKVLGSNAPMPAFYFVKADVHRAYDTIPQNKLEEVISKILSPDGKTSYCIQRYAVITRTRNGQIKKYYRRHVSTSQDYIRDMRWFVHHLQQSTSLRNAVIVEQSVSLKERCSNLFEFFRQLIYTSILKIKNRYYVQSCGIPQGSILSTLLCNLFYGDMENNLLHGVQEDGVLMRLTDDFLFVTPHLGEAKTFLRTLAEGIPEYGFTINPAKTTVNFSLDDDIPGCSAFKQLPAHSMFPWCGLLIDTQTLEVYCDYSRFADQQSSNSLCQHFQNISSASLQVPRMCCPASL